MNKQRKTSHILNVFQYDEDGHVILPASLSLTIAPGSEDDNSKVPTTAWVRALISSLGYVTLASDQTITGLKTIQRVGSAVDVLNFKIGSDTIYGLKIAYNQNELVPSGEATWSFVNTFNNGSSTGLETTPISFFRGVLVTGQRLLSASVNSNLLDYYGNNPSGRYPIYAYNTGVQQFSTGIIVGNTTGVVNAVTGVIADLPVGVVANFNGRVIGGNAVNSNEFVTLSQLGSYVPTSRTLTINGVSYDLSADRSWSIAAGVTSFNTRTGAITLSSGDVTGALGYTPYNSSNPSGYITASSLSSYLPLSGGNLTGNLRLVSISGNDQMVENTYGAYLHLGGWAVGRTDTTAVLVNTAYRADYATDLFDMNISRFTNNSGYITSSALSSYLPLSGGTLTGPVSLNDSSYFRGSPSYGFRFNSSADTINALIVDNSGNTFAYTSHRAPIFYDSNDTSYYVDPNSLSRMYRLQVIGDWAGGAPNEGAINIRGSYPSMTFRNTVSNNMWLRHMDGSGDIQHYFSPSGVDSANWTIKHTMRTDGVFSSISSMRSPVFYDLDNTGYYVDAASTTALYDLALVGAKHTYLYINPGNGYEAMVRYNGGSGSGWYAGKRTSNGINSTGDFHFYAESVGADVFGITTGGVAVASGAMAAPYFYDSNNTGYYLDPTGTTSLRTVGSWRADSTTWDGEFNGKIQYHSSNWYLQAAGNWLFRNSGGTNVFDVDQNGVAIALASMRTPIFYDYNNTGYYLNPDGLSYLYSLQLSGASYFRPNTWIQMDGGYGVYWPNNYGAHIYPNTASSYTQFRWDGIKNSYSGVYLGESGVNGIMYDASGNGGVYREGNGRWYWYYYVPHDCMGIGTSSTASGYSLYLNKGVFAQSRIDATIYYDSANTAYYLDPNGSTYLAGSVEVANGYFLANGIGGSMYMSAAAGSFGGYLKTSGHMVLDQLNAGYNVYVLDGNSVGVVKNAGSQSWSAFSDRTIKTIHSTIDNNLSKLESITPIYYSFNNFADDKNRIGLIAQEVQEHFPELVEVEPMTEKLVLDYTGLIPVLLGAIKELKNKVETLEQNLL